MMRSIIVVLIVGVFVCLATAALGANGMLTPMEELGKSLFFDKISEPNSMACAACHAPSVGFTGPIPGINKGGAVYRGAVPQRFGNRKPPSAAYATFSPVFDFDAGEGLFIGGNFWDGRATGEHLGNPAADQALGPFLNPVEQNNPSKLAVLVKVAGSGYADLWADVFGEPVGYSTDEAVNKNYNRIGLAIAAYEASREVNPFSSKFDGFWSNVRDAGMDVRDIDMSNWMSFAGYGLSGDELKGLALFNDEGKGKCSLCHVLDPVELNGMEWPPVLTDFSFDNLGVPKNPENPFYRMDKVYLDDGTPINPLGDSWIDPGLGGFLETRPEWQAMAAENYGKHKVPTLRNVDKRPGSKTKPPKFEGMKEKADKGLVKAYTHNGVFKSLKDVVHFYNTRDVLTWPPPEVTMNVNTDELGNLGLSDMEEDLIVLFMGTLSDGYTTPFLPSIPINTAEDASIAIVGPNPFNPVTTIEYATSAAGKVQLHAFDVAGRRVATLVDEWQDAGSHRAEFHADRLPSGVYFVRLATARERLVVKAILLK